MILTGGHPDSANFGFWILDFGLSSGLPIQNLKSKIGSQLRDSAGFTPDFPPCVRWLLPIRTDWSNYIIITNFEQRFSTKYSQSVVPQGGIQNSKFKIQTGIQRKRFIDFEWVVYFRRAVLVKTLIQNPKSKIQNPKSKIQNPKSKIQNPKSKIQNPKSKIQNSPILAFDPNE